MAASSALLQIGPILSRLQESVIAPDLLTEPKVGRNPVAPQVVDGDIMEPCVSVPNENGTSPATVAAAGPAEEPLEPSNIFHGFLVRPPNQTSPEASAPSVNFAISTAPASSSLV